MCEYHLRPGNAEQFAIWNLVAPRRDILLLQMKTDGFIIGFTESLAAEQTLSARARQRHSSALERHH